MAKKPISRHYDYGCTFRWAQGDRWIAVKRGYVCEGSALIVVRAPKNFEVCDRPGEDPANDTHTWIAAIPANPDYWSNDRYFVRAVDTWVQNNPTKVNPRDRTGAKYGV